MANLGAIQFYNHKNDTQYLSEDAVIFASGNEIVSNSWESMFLRSFISTNPRQRASLPEFIESGNGWESFHEGKRNLIIMSPMVNDPELIADIVSFNKQNPHCPIAYFQLQVSGQMKTSLNKTLHYLNGAYLFKDVMDGKAEQSLIGLYGNPLKVHFLGSMMTISGLYDKTGEVYHPFYLDPGSFQPYTDFCKETEDLIEFAKANVTNQALDPEELTYLDFISCET